jgi:hypothetical protein
MIMTRKTVLVIGLAAVSGYAITKGVVQRPAKHQAATERSSGEAVKSEAEETGTPTRSPSAVVERSFPPDLVAALRIEPRPVRGPSSRGSQRKPSASTSETTTQNSATIGIVHGVPVTELADPIARVALSFVGADREAEGYWIDAINDPSLSAHERQDLIEDLNEEGFFDPRNPTEDDLPLIVSRLQLIEELAPEAMDDVNSEAFAEAKKDLERMALRTQE